MKNHLLNILQDFKEFTSKHIMMKSYMDNILDSNTMNVVFPLMYIEQNNVDIEDGQITINMTIYMSDLLNSDRSNFTNILNDMLLCVIDFKDYFRYNENACEYYVGSISTAEPGRFEFNQEESAGYKFDIGVIIKHSIDKDNVPIE